MNKNVYLIGIKGQGMTGLALILKKEGYNVTGSDIREKFSTDKILKKAGIKYYQNFSPKHLPLTKKDVWFISSTAYLGHKIKNPEVNELRKRKIPITPYSEAVAELFNKKFGIAVCGTHGKTTTAALIASILKKAGKKPTALIGGEVIEWQSNALTGKGDFFVLEADEYRGQFLKYQPKIIAITNIDYDHPDYFKNEKIYREVFKKFEKNLKPGGKIFYTPKKIKQHFQTHLLGQHNQKNIYLAKIVTSYLGVEEKIIEKAISNFKGVRRRLEKIGLYKKNIIIDDYAHNPEKVTASLKTLKETYPDKKISVIFQPHTFSRTQKFLKEFAKSLILADHIYLLDIYSSAREKNGKINSDKLAIEIKKLGHQATNLKTIKNAIKLCRQNKITQGVWVTMGAGNVFRIAYALVKNKSYSSL